MTKNFNNLGINPLIVKALENNNIVQPTEIQQKAIPLILTSNSDLVIQANTGTGKTAAFGLPLLQLIDTNKNHIQAVILVPTRELGRQIYQNLESFAIYLPKIVITETCGGVPLKPQIEKLKSATHILVATPGRLVDLIQKKATNLNKTELLILDEADEMITVLKDSLDEIVGELPINRRSLLFSATMPGAIKQLVQIYLNKNVKFVSIENQLKVNQGIQHFYTVVDPIEKLDFLMHFLNSKQGERGIIFCKTKAAVNKLAKNLAINKFSSGALHGSLSQGIRDRIMEQFRLGYINIVVATDLAARGIDVKEISFVVHYHLPDVFETYIHRSGRTARAGGLGISIAVIQHEEEVELANFEKELGIKFEKFEKPTSQNIEENNIILWAKKILKSKPNQELSVELKSEIKSIFQHLSKDELIDKIIANRSFRHNTEK